MFCLKFDFSLNQGNTGKQTETNEKWKERNTFSFVSDVDIEKSTFLNRVKISFSTNSFLIFLKVVRNIAFTAIMGWQRCEESFLNNSKWLKVKMLNISC